MKETYVAYGVARAFADMVRSRLADLGWTETKFAEKVRPKAKSTNAATGYLSRVLNGGFRPPLDEMDNWADFLRLEGAERERFILLANLANGPETVETLVFALEDQVAALRRRLDAASQQPRPAGR